MRNQVEVLVAEAGFVDPHSIRLTSSDEHGARSMRDVTAEHIVIASGTEATRDPHIPFDGRRIRSSDDVLQLEQLPRSLTVVGAGVIGLEYASMFAALGVRVTLIDKRQRLLPFADSEITDTLVYHLRQNRMTMRLGEEVSSVGLVDDANGERVQIHLQSGKVVSAEKVL